MMGKTHIIIGLSYGLAMLPVVDKQVTGTEWGFMMVGLTLGSLLPDIDHPQSIISRKIPLVGGLVGRLAGHRGFFHSILGAGCLIVLLGFAFLPLSHDLQVTYGLSGLVIGYLLHIFADLLTVSGVKLFYPMKKNISLGVFTTGGIGEFILRWGLVAVCVLQVIGFLSPFLP